MSWLTNEEVIEKNKALAVKLRTAKIRGETHCVNCGWCCTIRSCISTPDEVVAIADFLGKTPQEAISEHFAIDSTDEVYYVKPLGRNITDLAGKYIPAKRTYNEGACLWLSEENKCRIYEVRPRTARECECWNDTGDDATKRAIQEWEPDVLRERFGITAEKYYYEDDYW